MTSEGWYRLLLRLYPPAFRRRFGSSMTAAFAAERDSVQGRGPRAMVMLWIVSVWHVAVYAAAEWVRVVARVPRRRAELRPRTVMAGTLGDVQVALRALRRQPGFATVVVLTLALGIGANTAVFSLVNAFLFAPLPFGESDRLVHLRDVIERSGEADWWYTPAPRSMYAIREGAAHLERIAGHEYRVFAVTGDVEPSQATGVAVSDQWLQTLRVAPVLGRGFTPEEEALGAQARVVLIGHGLWTRRMGGDSTIVGRTLSLNGEPHTAIGVMPPGFRYPWASDLWVLGDFDRNDGIFGLGTVARLADGATPETFQASLDELSLAVAEAYPDTHRDVRFQFVSMREQLFGNRPGLGLILLGAVALLLLIACINVSGVVLVRVLSRDRELAVRAALGAGAWRTFRLVLIEGAVLAALGGGLGLWIADLSSGALSRLSTASESGLGLVATAVTTDVRVTAFAIAVTALVTVVAGVLPAWYAAAPTRFSVLKETDRGGVSRGRRRVLGIVVVSEAGLAVALLAAAALVLDAYRALAGTERGYEVGDRYAVRIAMPVSRVPTDEARVQLVRRIVERLQAEPGVRQAGYAHHLPMTPGDWTRAYTVEGGVASESGRQVLANVRWVGPTYFETMAMSMERGRTFTAEEMDRGAEVVVVSGDFARRHWPNEDPIGRRFKLGELGDGQPWLQVVGVVAQAQEEWAFSETLYFPYAHRALEWVEMVVHTIPGTMMPNVRAAIREVDPDQPADAFRSLIALEAEDLRTDRAGAGIIALFGAGGLLLSMLGTYGVVGYTVRQRRRELGIRAALGSVASALAWLVVREGSRWILVGTLIGGAAAAVVLPVVFNRVAAVGESVQVQLFTQGPSVNPVALVAVIIAVLAAGMAACLLPARRAMREDPVQALRNG